MSDLQLVWFKRDLRVSDHLPLSSASKCGVVLPLYIVEPDLWSQPDSSARQWDFCCDCLVELQANLTLLGQSLIIRIGDPILILTELHNQFKFSNIWSHEETGNSFTYNRDLKVKRWCIQNSVCWNETPTAGIVRGLKSRSNWALQWAERMKSQPILSPCNLISVSKVFPIPALRSEALPSSTELNMRLDSCPDRQKGGSSNASAILSSFLKGRVKLYSRGISSPNTAFEACSRLSAHLAFGSISLREVVHASNLQGGTRMFSERLHWHCHFIQKLESQPSLEYENAHRAFDQLRDSNQLFLDAWINGLTGWPFVDSCMRALRYTGWLNFRMRAMLMAVASYHLWLPWRDSGLALARLFVDYEPGIHWNQCQMQAGTTGINSIRIYNPIKQGLDHDPHGIFIRKWCHELINVPLAYLHTPWNMSLLEQAACGCTLGEHYPQPLVDYQVAAKIARDKIWNVRSFNNFNTEAKQVFLKHGSRRSQLPRARSKSKESPGQLCFNLVI